MLGCKHVSKRARSKEKDILTSPRSTTGAWMGDIHADDHGRCAIQPFRAILIQFVIDTAHFHVEFERHICKVLRAALANLGRLNANGGHIQVDVAKVLQTLIYGLVGIGQHDKEQRRLWLDSQERISDGLNSRPPQGIGTVLGWKLGCGVSRVASDLHSARATHLAEARHDLLKVRVRRTAEFISNAVLDHKNCPLLQACTDCELDPSEIPRGFVVDGSRTSQVLDPGFGQDAPRDHGHVRTNADAERLEFRPSHPQSEVIKTLIDDRLPIHVRRLTRYSNHIGGMVIRKFSTERLIWKYFANFCRQVVCLLPTDVDQWQIKVLQPNLVFLGKKVQRIRAKDGTGNLLRLKYSSTVTRPYSGVSNEYVLAVCRASFLTVFRYPRWVVLIRTLLQKTSIRAPNDESRNSTIARARLPGT